MGAFFWDCSGYFYSGLGNNRIHGISIYKRTLIHSENGILMAEVTRELLRLPTGSQATGAGGRFGLISRQKLPKRMRILRRIPSKPYSVHSVHSAIGTRTESHSVHSENGIAPRRTWMSSIASNPIPELSQKNAPSMSSFMGFQEWKRLFNQINLMYLGLFLSVHLRTCSTLILLTALLSPNLTYWCSRWVFIAGKGAFCCCCYCYCCCWLSTFYIAPVTTKNKPSRDLAKQLFSVHSVWVLVGSLRCVRMPFSYVWFTFGTVTINLPTFCEFKAWECQSFWRWSDYFRRFPETSQDVPKNSEVLKFYDAFGIDSEDEKSTRLFFLQNRWTWDKSVIYTGLFFSRTAFSLHFPVVNGSFEAS